MKIEWALLRSTHVATSVKLIEIAPDLAAPGISMKLCANKEIFGEGDPADFVYTVMSGAARSSRLLSDGRRQIAAFHLPGDVFGFRYFKTHWYSAETIAPSEIGLVRRAALERAAERDSATARRLWSLTAQELEVLQDHLSLLGGKSAADRVGTFLLRLAKRTSSAVVDLPMSRGDIADHLGLTLETVSRTLGQLVRDKTIFLPSARRVVVRDLEALAAA
jgi:CRP/FNR family nitrogen fixation transcriptional regulator